MNEKKKEKLDRRKTECKSKKSRKGDMPMRIRVIYVLAAEFYKYEEKKEILNRERTLNARA